MTPRTEPPPAGPDAGAAPRMRSEDRRRQILEAAAQVFSRMGARGCALRDVAEACGITEALVHKHFGSRRDLLAATVAYAAETVYGEIESAAAGGVIERLCGQVFEASDNSLQACTDVLLQAGAQAFEEPTIAEALARRVEYHHARTVSLVTQAQTEGALTGEVDPDALAWLMDAHSAMSNVMTRLDVGFPGGRALAEATLAPFRPAGGVVD